MLPREHRLKKEMEIKKLFQRGKGVFHGFVGVKVRKNSFEESRFVVVVGTKVHKRAYKRNRIRRRIRAILNMHLAHVTPGFDVAVIAKPNALSATYADLERSVLSALRKARLYE